MRKFRKNNAAIAKNKNSWEASWNGAIEVSRRDDEDFERMLKRFTKKVKNSGILYDYEESLRYIKPSEKKRMKKRKRV